jgi:hypothetical protein
MYFSFFAVEVHAGGKSVTPQNIRIYVRRPILRGLTSHYRKSFCHYDYFDSVKRTSIKTYLPKLKGLTVLGVTHVEVLSTTDFVNLSRV